MHNSPHMFRSRLKALVHRRGGKFRGGIRAMFGLEAGGAEVQVREVLVIVDRSPSRPGVSRTRVRARYLFGAGPVFAITPQSVFRPKAPKLGFLSEFDRRFHCSQKHLVGARQVWSASSCKSAHTHQLTSSVRSDGEVLTLDYAPADENFERLETAVDLLAELAHLGEKELGFLRQIPGMGYSSARGDFESRTRPRIELDTSGNVVSFSGDVVKGRFCISVSVDSRAALPDLEREFDDLHAEALSDEVISASAKLILPSIVPGRLIIQDNRITFTLVGPASEERLQSAARFVTTVAGGKRSLGAFR